MSESGTPEARCPTCDAAHRNCDWCDAACSDPWHSVPGYPVDDWPHESEREPRMDAIADKVQRRANVAVERLTAERDEWKAACFHEANGVKANAAGWYVAYSGEQARVAALTEALRKYGEHGFECRSGTAHIGDDPAEPGPCDCGWDEVVRVLLGGTDTP